MQITTSRFLRTVLLADAATCLVSALLMIFGSAALGRLFGMPPKLFSYAGISLLPFTAGLVYIMSRERLSPTVVWAIIVLNVLWTADSFLIIATGWVTPNELGYAFVAAQALAVAVLTGLEYAGLKKSAVAAIL
jgi:hypothetical protein